MKYKLCLCSLSCYSFYGCFLIRIGQHLPQEQIIKNQEALTKSEPSQAKAPFQEFPEPSQAVQALGVWLELEPDSSSLAISVMYLLQLFRFELAGLTSAKPGNLGFVPVINWMGEKPVLFVSLFLANAAWFTASWGFIFGFSVMSF